MNWTFLFFTFLLVSFQNGVAQEWKPIWDEYLGEGDYDIEGLRLSCENGNFISLDSKPGREIRLADGTRHTLINFSVSGYPIFQTHFGLYYKTTNWDQHLLYFPRDIFDNFDPEKRIEIIYSTVGIKTVDQGQRQYCDINTAKKGWRAAIEKEDMAELTALRNANPELDRETTSILFAIRENKQKVVRSFAEWGLDFETTLKTKSIWISPINYALFLNRTEILCDLVTRGYKASGGGHFHPAADVAVAYGNVPMLKCLLATKHKLSFAPEKNIVATRKYTGISPLPMIRFLEREGFAKYKNGNQDGRYLGRLSLEIQGPDQKVYNLERRVVMASFFGDIELVKFLVEETLPEKLPSRDKYLALAAALQAGHENLVRYFIDELKTDLNLPFKEGYLPSAASGLLYTWSLCLKGKFHLCGDYQQNMLDFLLARGLNLSSQDVPWMYAQHPTVIHKLLSLGVSPSIKGPEGWTWLEYIFSKRVYIWHPSQHFFDMALDERLKLAEFIRDEIPQVDVNALTQHQVPILHQIFHKDNYDSPLYGADLEKVKRYVQTLLSFSKIDVNFKDSSGKTPLRMCKELYAKSEPFSTAICDLIQQAGGKE